MMSAEPSERQQKLVFGIRRSIRYHMRRTGFFDGLSNFISVTNAIFGTAAVVTLIGKDHGLLATIMSALVAAASIINLGLGLSRRARLHNDLAKRFIEIEKKLTKAGNASDELLGEIQTERLTVEADEPPVKRVLDALCHNELCKSMGREDQIYRVPWYKRWFADFFSFDASGLKRTRAQHGDDFPCL